MGFTYRGVMEPCAMQGLGGVCGSAGRCGGLWGDVRLWGVPTGMTPNICAACGTWEMCVLLAGLQRGRLGVGTESCRCWGTPGCGCCVSPQCCSLLIPSRPAIGTLPATWGQWGTVLGQSQGGDETERASGDLWVRGMAVPNRECQAHQQSSLCQARWPWRVQLGVRDRAGRPEDAIYPCLPFAPPVAPGNTCPYLPMETPIRSREQGFLFFPIM